MIEDSMSNSEIKEVLVEFNAQVIYTYIFFSYLQHLRRMNGTNTARGMT